jgi:hypothetical protein
LTNEVVLGALLGVVGGLYKVVTHIANRGFHLEITIGRPRRSEGPERPAKMPASPIYRRRQAARLPTSARTLNG